MYKLKNDLIPVVVGNHFGTPNLSAPTHSYNLRTRNRVSYIVPRLISSEKSIQVCGEKEWNDLPESIKNSTSLKKFKKVMKVTLLESYNV